MYVRVGDIDIFYTIAGVGPTCLVPSLAGTPIYERTFTPALQDVMRLVFVELRGNRTATGEIDALTFDAMVDDLDGVRRALGLGRVAVLGHSAHSFLALAYAARYPEFTSHVLAIAGAPGMTAGVAARTATYWDLIASPERKRIVAENRARLTEEVLARLTPSERVIVPYVANGPVFFPDPTYDCTPLWEGHEQISDRLFARFWGPQAQFGAFDPEANLPNVVAPVFIAQGVFDFAAPPHAWAGELEKLPNATYRAFERSGHYPQLDEREAFGKAVAGWLGRGK
ncbi:MAG TPA: alpha/beta hydrolase [Solirubrobacterales bacterium]|nr:alpha/beta hydrolase [Solirubrobacterales bacterium]